jgi:hypothetical protein
MRRQQRGIVAVVVAVGLLVLLAMAGLAIDIGHLTLNKSRLQSTVDAAALEAAKVLDSFGTQGQARDAANLIIAANAADQPELFSALFDQANPLGNVAVFVEFAERLDQPFAESVSHPRFVRVRAEQFPMWTSLTALLGFDKLETRASAVSGPSAPIENPCELFPVAVCALKDSTAPHWGWDPYGVSGNKIAVIKLAAGDPMDLGTGNYHLLRLAGSTGASDVRRDLAAGSACADVDHPLDFVDTKTGVAVGAVHVGVNTRFGIYEPPLNRDRDLYLPDRVVRTRPDSDVPETPLYMGDDGTITYNGEPVTGLDDVEYTYHDYLMDYGLDDAGQPVGTPDFTHPGDPGEPDAGLPGRRVVTIPIVDCSDQISGTSQPAAVKGFGCFFLLQPVLKGGGNRDWIFGQFVDECTATGNPGSGSGPGPHKIVLHDDPASTDS